MQCPRCGRPYCDNHGEEVCDACLEPASGLPSFTLYRGSLMALLIGTALAVWLILQPPGDGTSAAFAPVPLSPTAAAAGSGQTPAANTPGAGTPAARTPGPGTPAAGTTGTPAAGTGTYTVKTGEVLGGICNEIKPASMSVQECVDRVVALNSLSSPDAIRPGQDLIVPR
jgi:LysM repeat protein